MKDSDRRLRGILVNTITVAIAIATMAYLTWSLRPLILPTILGLLLAYLFRPLKTAFKYRWLPNSIRVALIFSLLTAGLLAGIRFVQNNIPNEKEKLEVIVRLKYKFNEKFNKMMSIDQVTGKGNTFYNLIAEDINPLRTNLNNYLDLSPEQQTAFLNYKNGVDGFDQISEKYYHYFLTNMKKSKRPLDPSIGKVKILNPKESTGTGDQSFLKAIIDILSIWLLLPIVFIFFLLDNGEIDSFFIRLVPNRYFELALTIQEEVDDAIGKYLRGISLECGLVALSMVIGLWLIGIPLKMSLLIGVLSGLATAIPFLGPVVGLGFGLIYVLIAEDLFPILPFVTMDNCPIAVVIVNVLVLVLDNMVFQPIVLGSAVNLHPLIVILGIMGGSMLFGTAGVLLAIPAIVIFNVIVQHTFRGLKDYRII